MGNSTRRREAFDLYYETGRDRTLEKLHQLLRERGWRVSLRTIFEWSRRDHWQERIADFDRQARVAADAARLDELRQMYERQAQEGILLQQRGAEALSRLDPEELPPDDGIRAIVEGARLERIARGEPTDRLAAEREDDDQHVFARFTEAELRLLLAFAEEATPGAVAEEPERPRQLDANGADDQRAADAADAGNGGVDP